MNFCPCVAYLDISKTNLISFSYLPRLSNWHSVNKINKVMVLGLLFDIGHDFFDFQCQLPLIWRAIYSVHLLL